jgi:hypothetical protein
MAVLSHVFIDMLGLGVTIVTGMDRKVYSNESVINNPMDLMYSIMRLLASYKLIYTLAL